MKGILIAILVFIILIYFEIYEIRRNTRKD